MAKGKPMNPWDLSASELMIWGLVLHLIADWPLQNDWMANNKTRRADFPYHVWFIRHPAAYVHAGIHWALLSIIFGWVALPLAIAHLIIDCRWVVAKWAHLMRQTPSTIFVVTNPMKPEAPKITLMDIGTEVRFWTDQVFHIVCVAIAAVLVSL
jgi:hypothetical protein